MSILKLVKIEEFILPILSLILDRFLDVGDEDARAVRQDGRIPCGLHMLGIPPVAEPLLLDPLPPEVELPAFSVDLRNLLRLHLERWDFIALGEMLINRVEHHFTIEGAAQLRRFARDK